MTLSPLLKYPGGKTRELPYIMAALPPHVARYFEPFVGGGAVYFALAEAGIGQAYAINDYSADLIGLYRAVQTQEPDFFATLAEMDKAWLGVNAFIPRHRESLDSLIQTGMRQPAQIKARVAAWVDAHASAMTFVPAQASVAFFADLPASLARKLRFLVKQAANGVLISAADRDAILHTAFKSSLYVYWRARFNQMTAETPGVQAALYLNMRQYCYSGMFRYSKTGAFNVPYGGKTYNDITLSHRAAAYQAPAMRALLNKTALYCGDFADFLTKAAPQTDDFIFLDPPYDSDFSTYAQHDFGQNEQRRLATFLTTQTLANWQLVIKDTPFIRALYPAGQPLPGGRILHVTTFDKTYGVNFKNRNARDVAHLLITSYPVGEED
ncbi:DNA adenine methylase [Lacticaseibacillus mingshuiensis]|uniref:site-specific DNA-methyltransferase (adenine-specific) n=1 Tax=Lacticaseibacillus mingshuiensis TaxID=2799574 RepID=A0ABW4CF71_9LACO|nr:DNA adenine methylase [Lacticaseibacillus mingshuiensis]